MTFKFIKYSEHDKLVIAAQNGDEQAFAQICESYRPLFFKYFGSNRNLNLDNDEWQQQMRIFTFMLYGSYDTQYNRTFGNFLDVGLKYRIIDLQRQQKGKQFSFEKKTVPIDLNMVVQRTTSIPKTDCEIADGLEKRIELSDSLLHYHPLRKKYS